ncbi:DUF6115 domain-containing protein [Salirhabdus salicampi]|uniref:DUF6115 domain-containing protein n=1 Tax=Salirhabdus salicampi TaxID=476102 RepID=UPI0020C3980A|nr:helix-turn-helix domain-containing protein [Salirhabdus salicampi]MCP8616497.1 DUF2802 domain-containing protein [Salirhabdus salicampi]
MLTFYIVFSLALHVVTFLLFIYVYRKYIQPIHQEEKSYETVQEIEGLFQSYLQELKDENEKFLNNIQHVGNDENDNGKVPVPSPSSPNELPDHQEAVERKEESRHVFVKEDHGQTEDQTIVQEQSYIPESLVIDDEIEPPKLHTRVVQLYEQGYSVEEIARKLNIGKTEIELFIKFHRNNK